MLGKLADPVAGDAVRSRIDDLVLEPLVDSLANDCDQPLPRLLELFGLGPNRHVVARSDLRAGRGDRGLQPTERRKPVESGVDCPCRFEPGNVAALDHGTEGVVCLLAPTRFGELRLARLEAGAVFGGLTPG